MPFGTPNVEKLKAKGDVKGLIKASSDKDDRLAVEAIRALGDLSDPAAVDPLLEAIKGSRGIEIRGEATKALGRIGDPRAVEPLVAAMDSLFALMVTSMAEALDAADQQKAVLIAIYELLAKEAATALGLLGDARALEKLGTLRDFLQDKLPGILDVAAPEKQAIARGFQPLADDLGEAVRHAIAQIEVR